MQLFVLLSSWVNVLQGCSVLCMARSDSCIHFIAGISKKSDCHQETVLDNNTERRHFVALVCFGVAAKDSFRAGVSNLYGTREQHRALDHSLGMGGLFD